MTTTTPAPDLFTNVHKGIRRLMFAACAALGRAGDDATLDREARALLRDALRFTAHHGDNEDQLLLPLLRVHAPDVATRMERAHQALHEPLAELQASDETTPIALLYQRASRFVGRYLEHMYEEENELEPAIRAALTVEQQLGFARESVARTAPADQRLMLGWMLRAMTPLDAEAMLARLPAALADDLRPPAV